MSVPSFTTPTFTLTFSDQSLDLTQATSVYVTFRSKGFVLTKTGADLNIGEKQIVVLLSQYETSRFLDEVKIQANWITPGGLRAASDVVTYQIDEQLLLRVIS